MINALDTLTTVAIAIQAWTLREVVSLKVKIAGLPCHGDNRETCEKERKKNMKKLAGLILIIAFSVGLLLTAGCTTPNPNPPAPGQPYAAYVADAPAISNAVYKATGVIQATAPFNPYAGLLSELAWGVGGLITVVSTLVAGIQSKRAKTAANAAQTLAQGVVKAGPQAAQAVLDHAAYLPNYADVASHINDATP